MSGGVILVRHAMPEVVPGLAASLWELGEHAKEDCVLLAHALPDGLASPVISSGQRKVDQTATIIALRKRLRTRADPRVREVEQPGEWIEDDYRGMAAAYLGGDTSRGWEPRDAVRERFSTAVTEARTSAGAADVVVVNHGLAMSLYLDGIRPEVVTFEGRRPFALAPFWRALTFPDAWRLDFAANTLTRVFNGGMAPE